MKHQSTKSAKFLLPDRNHLGSLVPGKLFSANIEQDKDCFAKNYSRVVRNGFVNLKKK